MIPTDYTGPAVWRNASEDKPVKILSCLGEKDSLPYFQIDSDSPGGVPGDQLFLPFDPTHRQLLIDRYINDLGWGLCYLKGKNPKAMGDDWHKRPITRVEDFPPNKNIGLNHAYSKTATLDLDHPAASLALAAIGIDLDSLLKTKYKIIGDPNNPPKPIYRLPHKLKFEPTTKQLKWPDPSGKKNKNGTPALITILELRGGNAQDVLPPSIHPDTGTPYRWKNGKVPEKYENLLILPPKLLMLWENWDSFEPKLKAVCPWAEIVKKQPAKQTVSEFDPAIVPQTFNEKYKPSEILERNGYEPKGHRWLCPNSSSGIPGVIALGDGEKILSFHGSDPLGDGKPHDAFDCYTILEYDGDKSKAWHTAKDELGINFSQNGNHNHITDETESIPDEPKAEPAFKRLSLAELIARPAKVWLLDNLIGELDLCMIFGDSGTGKTFATVDLIFCAILGRPFAGKFNINRPLSVAYCASEGIGGLPQRFCAAGNHYQITLDRADNLSLFLDVPQLFEAKAITSIYNFVDDWKLSAWGALDLLIIDTLHGATFGGDENSSRDAGLILQAVKYARDMLHCSVLLVHHANRQGKYRGSSALHGAMDSMFQTKQVGILYSLECFKQKDVERFAPLYFKLTPEHYSQSAYAEWVDDPGNIAEDSPKLPKKEQAKKNILALLKDEPDLSQSEIVNRITTAGRSTVLDALKELEAEGAVKVTSSKLNNQKIYQLGLF